MNICQQNEKKKLYIVSLGPGGSGLVTLDALNVLSQSQVIFVTTKDKKKSLYNSRSYQIVKELSDWSQEFFQEPFRLDLETQVCSMGKETTNKIKTAKVIPLYHPMTYSEENWVQQSKEIIAALQQFDKVSYTTLGDAAVYSTAYFLLPFLQKQKKNILASTQVLPGITSFSLASAKIKKPLCLGDSSFCVTSVQEPQAMSTVYMRPHKEENYQHLAHKTNLYTFSHLNAENEYIQKGTPAKPQGYMELLIDFFE